MPWSRLRRCRRYAWPRTHRRDRPKWGQPRAGWPLPVPGALGGIPCDIGPCYSTMSSVNQVLMVSSREPHVYGLMVWLLKLDSAGSAFSGLTPVKTGQ